MNNRSRLFDAILPEAGVALLKDVGFSLSSFNVVQGSVDFVQFDLNCPPDLDSAELLVESIVGWMPEAKWYLMVVNEFNTFDVVANYKYNLLLSGSSAELGTNPPTFTLCNVDRSGSFDEMRILLSELALLVLRNQGHVQIVSECVCLSLQDGSVRFSAPEGLVRAAKVDFEQHFRNGIRPGWVCDILARF